MSSPNEVIDRWFLQSAARELLPNEYVALCMRSVVVTSAGVHVMHSPQKMRAFYRNLLVCGLLWACPICGEKICERRRQELIMAVDNTDLKPALLTFTLQHDIGDNLKVLLSALLDSYRRLKSGKRWDNFVSQSGWVGSVRGLEVTYGENGWHPHVHVLAFFRDSNVDGVEGFLKERWRAVLEHNAQTASYANGVTVSTADKKVTEYVTKFGHEPINPKRPFRWGMESEVTKSQLKRSRSPKGRTPIELLTDYAMGDKPSGKLWREYAMTFKGRNQLVWSRGLRALFGLGKPESDGEAAKAEPDDAVLLAKLSLPQWKIILDKNARGDVLRAARTGDVGLLNTFLHDIGADAL
jgi:hypothetical protein